MSEELLDIFNEQDELIGQATYPEVRANNHIIRAIHCWVMNSEGKFLFQLRKRTKKSMPGTFDASVGGRVDPGETYEQAAAREMQEELGIEPDLILAGKHFEPRDKERKFMRVYLVKSDGPFNNWQDEAEVLEWMDYAEYSSVYRRFPYLFASTETLEVVQEYLKEQTA